MIKILKKQKDIYSFGLWCSLLSLFCVCLITILFLTAIKSTQKIKYIDTIITVKNKTLISYFQCENYCKSEKENSCNHELKDLNKLIYSNECIEQCYISYDFYTVVDNNQCCYLIQNTTRYNFNCSLWYKINIGIVYILKNGNESYSTIDKYFQDDYNKSIIYLNNIRLNESSLGYYNQKNEKIIYFWKQILRVKPFVIILFTGFLLLFLLIIIILSTHLSRRKNLYY